MADAVGWSDLSDELKLLVLHHYVQMVNSTKALGRLASVSRDFARLVYDCSLWRRVTAGAAQEPAAVIELLSRLRGGGTRELELVGTPRLADELLAAMICKAPDLELLAIASPMSWSAHTLAGLAPLARSLRVLRLERVHLHAESLDVIGALLPRLVELSLRRCSGAPFNTPDALVSLAADGDLRALALDAAWRMSPATLAAIAARHSRLSQLSLDRCTDALAPLSIDALAALPLATLRAGFCSSAGADGFASLVARTAATLTVLDTGGCECITTACVRAWAAAAPRLTTLILDHAVHVHDDELVALLQVVGPTLRALSLDSLWAITDVSVHAIGTHCGQLTSLSLASCGRVTGFGLAAVTAGCRALGELSLNNVRHLTRVDYVETTRALPALSRVNFSNSYLHDDTVEAIATHLDRIVTISLEGIQTVGTRAVAALLARHGDSLEVLSLRRCSQVMDEAVDLIVARAPRALVRLELFGVAISPACCDRTAEALGSRVNFFASAHYQPSQFGLDCFVATMERVAGSSLGRAIEVLEAKLRG